MPRRALLASAVIVAVLALPLPVAALADGPCPVLSPTAPLPVEFSDGSVAFRQNIFARPGVTVASTGPNVAKALRVAGASTAYWEMNLQNLAGTPTAPADPATMDAVAASEVQKAQASTACANPLIALNELLGSDIPGPLPRSGAALPGLGTRPHARARGPGRDAVPARPAPLHGDGDGGLVAPDRTGGLARAGGLHPGDRARGRRESLHHQPRDPRALPRVDLAPDRPRHPGLPPRPDARLPVGSTGRAGLQPSGTWLGVVKLQSQAGLVVSRELALSSLWSWGWGTFTGADAQPPVPAEKQAAACTYLWARDPSLCDAPTVAATSNIGGFDADLTAGAFDLAPELQCRYAGGSFTTKELTALTAAGVTSASALTALLERSLVRTRATIGPTALLRAERSVIAGVFAGKRGQYQQFLQVEGATPAVARDVIRDQLLAAKVARGLRVAPITGAGVTRVHPVPRGHAHAQCRDRAPVRWLVGQTRGVAIPGLAPPSVLSAATGSTVLVHAEDGPVRVRVLGAKVALPRAERSKARLAVRALMLAEARRVALRDWLAGAEQAAVDTALCRADDMPLTGRSQLLQRWPELRLQP